VYGFIRQSGGNIRILSTPGKGTNVRFIVPMTDPARPPQPARQRHRHADTSRLVLLVEDEPEVRKVIRQQLTELGYPVLEAANGLEAGPCSKPSRTSPARLRHRDARPRRRELAARPASCARAAHPADHRLRHRRPRRGTGHPDPAQTLRPRRPRRALAALDHPETPAP
jgi:hypothetical protein